MPARRAVSPLATAALSNVTNRWSGRVRDKVPFAIAGARAAQLNRQASLKPCA